MGREKEERGREVRGSYDSEFGFVKDEGVGRKGVDLGEEEERFVGVEGVGGGLQQLESFGEDLVANGEPSLNDKYESSLSLPLSLSASPSASLPCFFIPVLGKLQFL